MKIGIATIDDAVGKRRAALNDGSETIAEVLSRYGWFTEKGVVTSLDCPIDKRFHRALLKLMGLNLAGLFVFHLDGDHTNNQLDNLRLYQRIKTSRIYRVVTEWKFGQRIDYPNKAYAFMIHNPDGSVRHSPAYSTMSAAMVGYAKAHGLNLSPPQARAFYYSQAYGRSTAALVEDGRLMLRRGSNYVLVSREGQKQTWEAPRSL